MQRADGVDGHEVRQDIGKQLEGHVLPEPRVLAGEGDVAINLEEGGVKGDEEAVIESVFATGIKLPWFETYNRAAPTSSKCATWAKPAKSTCICQMKTIGRTNVMARLVAMLRAR